MYSRATLVASPIAVPGGERVKNELFFVEQMQRQVFEHGIDRHSYLIAVGVYALLRCFGMVFPAADTGLLPWISAFAGLTMLCGVLGAASRGRIREILSFHIVSQIGYMIVGAALLGRAALATAIFSMVPPIVVKSNLFLIAGQSEGLVGSDDLDRLGGAVKRAPWLGILFLIPALSLAGIPLTAGFVGKFYAIMAGFEGGVWWLVLALVVNSAASAPAAVLT